MTARQRQMDAEPMRPNSDVSADLISGFEA
jgi:hypothetical protein